MRSASFSRLGKPAWGARFANTSGAMPWTKSCAISPLANTQRPALMPCANLIFPGPSSTGSSGVMEEGPVLLMGEISTEVDGEGAAAFTACDIDRQIDHALRAWARHIAKMLHLRIAPMLLDGGNPRPQRGHPCSFWSSDHAEKTVPDHRRRSENRGRVQSGGREDQARADRCSCRCRRPF